MVKGKGSAFEREICVKLSQWVSKGTRNDIFWRTAMSGGRATVFKKKGALMRQAGDVTAVSFEGHDLTDNFYLELKFYKDLGFTAFFAKNGGLLAQFWSKAQDEAQDFGLKPILIVKQNFVPILFIMRPHHIPKHWLEHTKAFCVEVRHRGCAIYRFDDVMRSSYVKPSLERIR